MQTKSVHKSNELNYGAAQWKDIFCNTNFSN